MRQDFSTIEEFYKIIYIFLQSRNKQQASMEVFSFFFPSLFPHHQRWRHVLAIPKLSTFAFAPPTGRHTCKSKRAKFPPHKNWRALHIFIASRSTQSKAQATGVWCFLFNNIFTFSSHKQTNIDNTKQK